MKKIAFMISCFLIFLISGCGDDGGDNYTELCFAPVGEYKITLRTKEDNCHLQVPPVLAYLEELSENDEILSCGWHEIKSKKYSTFLNCTINSSLGVDVYEDGIMVGDYSMTFECAPGSRGYSEIGYEICTNYFSFEAEPWNLRQKLKLTQQKELQNPISELMLKNMKRLFKLLQGK
ncbi:hypothetical protein ACFL29_01145 [Patescibacteria group bacterium]